MKSVLYWYITLDIPIFSDSSPQKTRCVFLTTCVLSCWPTVKQLSKQNQKEKKAQINNNKKQTNKQQHRNKRRQ